LRDQLGVKVDLSDDIEEKEKEGGKKRKAVHQKSKVTVSGILDSECSYLHNHWDQITGRKENVEEAKKRILNQLERLASFFHTNNLRSLLISLHALFLGR
jgi:hypothetical protein